MALGSTQPLTEMSTRRISWGKMRPVRKADNFTTPCAVVMKSGKPDFLDPSGPLQACNGTALPICFEMQCEIFMNHREQVYYFVSQNAAAVI